MVCAGLCACVSGGGGLGRVRPIQHQTILGYQQDVQEFNSIMTLSTWRQYPIPQVKVYETDLHPAPLQVPVPSSDCYLFFRPTGYKSEVPKIPSLGFTNFLERLTVLDFLFIIKACNWGTEETHKARYREMARSSHILSRCATLPKSPRVYHPRRSPNPVSLWRLWLNHWPLAI